MPLSQVPMEEELPYAEMPEPSPAGKNKLGLTPAVNENTSPQFVSPPPPQQMHQPQPSFFSPGGSSQASTPGYQSSTPGFVSPGMDYMGSMFGRGVQ